MNEKKYEKLCKVCDELLMIGGQKLSVIAIPWLHVLRYHPVLLKKYTNLFVDKPLLQLWLINAITILRGFAHFVTSVFNQGSDIKYLDMKHKKVDFLFVSHILNENQAGCYEDFYFGSVPALLADQGKTVLIILLNHSNNSSKRLSNKWDKNQVPRAILTKKVSPWNGILIYGQMLIAFFQIRAFKRHSKNSFTQKVASIASVEALSSGTFANIRLELQIAEIIKNYSPLNLIVTYEGHAYERMIFHAAKRINADICCIGYQHSALFKLQHSFSRLLKSHFNFDVLLTPSILFKERLLYENKIKGVVIDVLGSNRGIGLIKKSIDRNVNYCLVRFSLEVARENPNLYFIWRLHPAINFAKLKKSNLIYDIIPSNIILSNESLEYDISRCDSALYRGSTAIVKAVAHGLLPIYFKTSRDEPTIDPLFFFKDGKVEVTTPNEYKKIFKSTNSMYLNNPQFQMAINSCKNFFDPFDINVFSRI